MKIHRVIVVSAFLMLGISTTCLAKEWRGIIPLHSTRVDVERLLGIAPKAALIEYDLPEEKVSIEYQTFGCDHTPPEGWPVPPPGWNVPKDTVVAVRIALKNPTPLAGLKININDFAREQGNSDVPQLINYYNEEDGFSIEVFSSRGGKKEDVMAFIYLPTVKDKRLRCPQAETR